MQAERGSVVTDLNLGSGAAMLPFLCQFVQLYGILVHLYKLLVHPFVQMYNEYKNIVLDSNTYTNTFFFVAKKKGIQKRNKSIGGIRLRRLICF